MRSPIAYSLAAITAALVFTPAASASTWHAAPGGGGVACTAVAPCTANYAVVTKAQDDDTVVFAGGDYAITATVQASNWISLEGATTGVPTRLIGGPGVSITLAHVGIGGVAPAHITDLRVTNQANVGHAVLTSNLANLGMTVDRVYAETSGTNATALHAVQQAPGSGLVVRNSIGRSTGAGSTAMSINGPDNGIGSAEIRNVLADARGATGTGLRIAGTGVAAIICGDFNVVMKNSIARSAQGPSFDLNFSAGFGTFACNATLASHNSNWRAATSVLPIGSIGDQHGPDPLFANAAGGDYHQVAGSPTIDAGATDGAIGPVDLDNQARVQGAAPDIGPFEFAVPPDTTAPVGSVLKLTPKSFLPRLSKPASVAAAKKKKKPKGSTARFTLTEAATVKFTVQRRAIGRKKDKSCSAKRKTGKKCAYYKSVKGSFSRTSPQGANSFKFTGFMNGKALKPGSYRLVGVPTDAAGNAGTAFRAAFKILKK